MKKLAVLTAAAAFALPVAAQAQVTIDPGAVPGTVSTLNDFDDQLATSLGLTHMSTDASVVLAAGNWAITFYLLGSESGYNDSFSAPGMSTFTETSDFTSWGETYIGTGDFTGWAGGSLAGALNFTSLGGKPATVGQAGFGVFLTSNSTASFSTGTFYFGYDDQLKTPDSPPGTPDDNHDDLIIKAVVSPIPEPSTWGLMILGFGALGMAMRGSRRRETSIGKINFA